MYKHQVSASPRTVTKRNLRTRMCVCACACCHIFVANGLGGGKNSLDKSNDGFHQRGLFWAPCSIMRDPGLTATLGSTKMLALVHILAVGADAGFTNAARGDSFLRDGPLASHEKLGRLHPSFAAGRPASTTFTNLDLQHYVSSHWQPGEPLGTSCAKLSRLGSSGDGGKLACEPAALLGSADECLVVSVGSNGDASFEHAVLDVAPHCEVDIIDPFEVPEHRASAPRSARLFAENFSKHTAVSPRYRARHVQLLKIDCEGCGECQWVEPRPTSAAFPL